LLDIKVKPESLMSTKEDPKNTKAPNDIRIGMNSRVRNVIRYSQSIMEEKKLRELKFSAVGGSIGRLLDTVEVLKVLIPNLYQQNKITSVAYQTLDSNNTVLNQRLYPKMEVILSLDEFKTKNEGTQDKLPEEQRKQIEKTMNERREQREKDGRRGFRPRRFNRRGFRGRRGFRRGFRGFRGGNRNFRVARNTGGNRRGAPRRGAQQRGMRGQRRGNNK
jgi:hypothetical protein